MDIWGVHNDSLTTELVDDGFISVGWDGLPDLTTIPNGREGLKKALTKHDPDAKPRSIAGQAGVLLRFRDEMQQGDLVVAPYKPESTINLGVVTSEYYYEPGAVTHRHRRRVEWRKVGLPRTVFSQSALYEIGSVLTVFRIRRHEQEFLTAFHSAEGSVDDLAEAVDHVVDKTEIDGESDEPRASRIERHTRDFVLETLHRDLTHREFEEFTAALLRTLGYQARVTPFSQDGGVDVIAHRDPLGVEPPQLKVQCKHRTATVSAPEVQQLIGTQGVGDLSIFVTLGGYSRDALAIERQRTGLRLLSGEDVVSLVLDNYADLPEIWKAVLPLARILVVADSVGT